MIPTERFRGTPSVAPRKTVGVVAALGRKLPGKNFPVDKDRFWLVNPVADAKGLAGIRHPHPDFATFNTAAPRALTREQAEWAEKRGVGADEMLARIVRKHNDERTVLLGTIVHATRDEAFYDDFRAQKLKGHENPSGGPACQGNEVWANRWMPAQGAYLKIPCPGKECPYRVGGVDQRGNKTRAPCGPKAALVFQLRMVDYPSALCRMDTGAFEGDGNIKGFFDKIDEQAKALGVEHYSLFSLPIRVHLTRRTKQGGSEWYVPDVQADFPPGTTLQDWLLLQMEKRRELAGPDTLQIGMAPTALDSLDDTDVAAAATAGNIGADEPPAGVGVPANQWGRP